MASAKLFNPPPGAAAKVSVIDSTGNIGQIPMTYLMTPKMPGFDTIHNTVSWSFYVESPNGKKALFDLGIPPDWEEFAEPLANDLKNRGWNITAEKHVYDILKDHNVDPDPINSIIWRYGNKLLLPNIALTLVVIGIGIISAVLKCIQEAQIL